MQYILLLHSQEGGWAKLTSAEQQRWMKAYQTFTEALVAAGAYKGGNQLQRSKLAATVRTKNGKPLVTDGPFAETKEQLGGYFVIDVPNRRSAIAWAKKCPAAKHGVVEVRPLGSPKD